MAESDSDPIVPEPNHESAADTFMRIMSLKTLYSIQDGLITANEYLQNLPLEDDFNGLVEAINVGKGDVYKRFRAGVHPRSRSEFPSKEALKGYIGRVMVISARDEIRQLLAPSQIADKTFHEIKDDLDKAIARKQPNVPKPALDSSFLEYEDVDKLATEMVQTFVGQMQEAVNNQQWDPISEEIVAHCVDFIMFYVVLDFLYYLSPEGTFKNPPKDALD